MAANPFANQSMSLRGSDVVFGVSSRRSATERYTFTPTDFQPNALKIVSNGKQAVPVLFPDHGCQGLISGPSKRRISTQTELDIAIVLDRSGSMAYSTSEISGAYTPAAAPLGWQFGQMVPPASRWLDAMAATESFLSLLSTSRLEERVALTTYSSDFRQETNLSKDFTGIRASLAKHTAQFAGGATNIGDGILTGIKSLRRSQVRTAMGVARHDCAHRRNS